MLGSGPTRNAEAAHAHNVLTRNGTPPGELIRLGREEVDALPAVTVEEAHVVAVEADEGADLRVRTDAGGTILAQSVLLATGARDTLPDVSGLAALWGRRAHSCPFCDAEAYAGQRLLVLADEMGGAHFRALLAGWTNHLTVADPSQVTALEETDGAVIARLTDGAQVHADGVFVGVTPVPRLDCVAEMPLARRGPFLAVDGDGRTSHPRLWAAGDCAWRQGESSPGGQVVMSMAAAARAGIGIVFERLDVHPPPPPPVGLPTAAMVPSTPAEDVRA